MNQITTQTRVGTGGVVHLDIPTDFKQDTNIDVTITFEPSYPDLDTDSGTDENGWPIGFFERTAGAWQGELERDQPKYQENDMLTEFFSDSEPNP